ncbi:hypothetical protein HBH44_226290 [Parastagonospora nodorum]|nr:hypothetical protein HBH45_227390 [Parastagonospora nodorum]KAH4147344.1 hypothetical protein HBH44_226290 [Parastagonospora nodorum]KAH4614183.1 hypothetical protein HBH55_226880 [Parastagonospora nodorum]KAH4620413.1 hypothetical protein HBH81_226490 [Parastagonospora nodorum]
MLQTNVREGYRITTLEVIELIEDLISYQRSSSVVFNRSIALITDKFSVALLTKLAILNNANVALVDAMHYSVVIDALMMTLIKNDDDLLGTVNSYIKLRRLRARCKTEAADSRYAKASRGRTKKDKDLEDSNTSSDLEKEAQLKKTRDEEELAKLDSLLNSDDYCSDSSLDINSKNNLEDKKATTAKDLLTDAYILYFKELLSNNSRIFANAIGIGKTRAIVLAVLIGHFCFFSDSSLENIGRLTKEEAIEMRINTTNAISKALTAANKLVALQSYVLGGFIIVCGFRKVDKHVFRAYNTISVTAQRTIIRKGGPYIEKRFNATNKRDSVTSNRIYKIEDARNIIANVKHNASEHKSSYKDILEKEGLNKLEASRRVIFNCFKMQAIASYSALATLKAAQFKTYSSCKVKRFTLNSVKDLFTNLSKDYFLVREARAITKSSLNIAAEDAAKAANILLLPKEVCAKILIESYKPIVQAIIVALIAFAEVIILTEATYVVIIELIIYFNLDSELELKVLGKQDVKTTS